MRAFDLCASEPWLITEEYLHVIMEIAGRTNDIDALMARTGRQLQNTRRVTMREGVAIVPVVGPIIRYANLFSEISGATSTQVLATDIRAALDDPLVKAIVLDVNSPGGMASGINELGDLIFEGRKEKPIIAYAGGQMASAAYWLGSGADEIVADRTAVLGSIGAIMTITDSRGRDERMGVRTIEIVSSQSPDKRLDINEDASRAKLQRIVDDLAGVFVSAVARNRGVDEDHVLDQYGRGGLMVGQSAVDAGLADRIGSLESVITELTTPTKSSTRITAMTIRKAGAEAAKGPITVRTQTELQAALAAGHAADEITLELPDTESISAAAVQAAREAWEAEQATAIEAAVKAATDTAVQAAVTAERERIVGLRGITVKGFEAEIDAAIASGATVEATAVALAKTQKDRGVTLGSLKAGSPAPVTHGGASNGGDAPKSKWGSITSHFKPKGR